MQFGNKSFPDCVYHEATLGEETKGPSNTIFVVRTFSIYRSTEIPFPGFSERSNASRRFVAHEYRRLEPCRSLDLTVCRLKAGLQTQDTSIAENFLRLSRWVRVSDYRVPEYRPAAIAECEKDELRNSTHDTIENRYCCHDSIGRS